MLFIFRENATKMIEKMPVPLQNLTNSNKWFKVILKDCINHLKSLRKFFFFQFHKNILDKNIEAEIEFPKF